MMKLVVNPKLLLDFCKEKRQRDEKTSKGTIDKRYLLDLLRNSICPLKPLFFL